MTWDRFVILAAIMADLGIDFSRIFIAEIHETPFKATTMLRFPYLNFNLCREASVPIWHYDKSTEETKTLDVIHIKYDANHVASHKGPQVDLPSLGVDLAADME